MIDAPLRDAERKDGGLHLKGVVVREREHCLAYRETVAVSQPAHHTEVEPNDAPVSHPDVAGMGVCMEKSILDDLLDVVLAKLPAERIHVVTALPQPLEIVDAQALDVLHDEEVLRRELAVDLWAGDRVIVAVEMGELIDVIRLHQEVHFLLRDCPHLIEHHIEVEDVGRLVDDFEQRHSAPQEHDVLAHDLVDAGALHLDDDLLARHEDGEVHLRDARRAERFLVDVGKDLLPALVALVLDDFQNDGIRKRLRLSLQLHELVAVLRRQEVGTHAHDLPELYEGRP